MRLNRLINLVFCTILALLSLDASAQWKQVSEGENSIDFIDITTLKKINNQLRVWVLYDYKSPKVIAGEVSNSLKTLKEFDCKEDRSRSLTSTFHSGQMGSGMVNYRLDTPTSWSYIAPDAVDSDLLNIVCKRK